MKKITILVLAGLIAMTQNAIGSESKLMAAFISCVNREAMKYSVLPESAEIVAKTAATSCVGLAKEVANSNDVYKLLTPIQQSTAIESIRDSVIPLAMKAVMDKRLAEIKTNQ